VKELLKTYCAGEAEAVAKNLVAPNSAVPLFHAQWMIATEPTLGADRLLNNHAREKATMLAPHWANATPRYHCSLKSLRLRLSPNNMLMGSCAW
jgi:hypothetical protein